MSLFEDYRIDSGHLGIDAAGNFEGVYGAERVAQCVNNRLNTQLGEWKFDTTKGVDWRGVVLLKNPDLIEIRAEIVGQIQGVAGMDRVTKLDLEIATNRVLLITWEGLTIEGIPIGGVVS